MSIYLIFNLNLFMNKSLFLFFLCCGFFLPANSFGQSWSWDWVSGGTGGSEGWAVCTDPWGNVFGLGYPYGTSVQFGSITLTGFGGQAPIVVKYDASGNLIWAQSTQKSKCKACRYLGRCCGQCIFIRNLYCPVS